MVIEHTDYPGLAGTTPRTAGQSFGSIAGLLRWCVRAVLLMQRVRSERAALRELDATQLADIGIGSDAARREAERAPWDLAPPRK